MYRAQLKYVPTLLFVAKIFTYFTSRTLFHSATYAYFANSAGKSYYFQGHRKTREHKIVVDTVILGKCCICNTINCSE